MAILGFEMEEIAQLLALVESQQWEELILEEESRYLRIRGPRTQSLSLPAAPPPPAAPLPITAEVSVAAGQNGKQKALPAAKPSRTAKADKLGALAADQVALTAPMVGVFYRADKPGASPFIQVGDRITVGQPIGIIEAMKIFSEIPAEHAGIVVAIPAEDGQLVQTGQPLMILQKAE
ncbi:MAG TPA: biotin/lipoyl-containing protein [Chthonomonadaceae bacterium]|nr:biotin/lipoyl-containing protein [Chthonomonadaceae bacterium]